MKAGEGYDAEGVRGLKALGVRDLTYRLAFLACSVQQTRPGVRCGRGQERWMGGWRVGGMEAAIISRKGERNVDTLDMLFLLVRRS